MTSAHPAPSIAPDPPAEDCTTIEVARRLGLAVRSVQLMVDRGDLQAWKTPGGHRRIARASVDSWLAARRPGVAADGAGSGGAARVNVVSAPAALTSGSVSPGVSAGERGPRVHGRAGKVATHTTTADAPTVPRVLLIEDSRHFQNLVALLVRQQFPGVELHLADDGIAGLAMAGQLQPDVLLVDLLLPGIDGATLIAGLRAHAAFGAMRLVVVTSLQGDELLPFAHALDGLPVVHKARLVADLPPRLAAALRGVGSGAGDGAARPVGTDRETK
jgi:excisionase family DNA binding protein